MTSYADLDRLHQDGRLSQAAKCALALLGSRSESAQRLRILSLLGRIQFDSGDVVGALSTHGASIEAAAAEADCQAEFDATLSHFAQACQFQTADESLPGLGRVRQLASRVANAPALGGLHLAVARIEAMRGLYSNGRRHLELSRRLFSTSGVLAGCYVDIVDSVLECYAGNLFRAQKSAETGLGGARAVGRRTLVAASHANLGCIELFCGRVSRAEHGLEIADRDSSEMASLQLVIADTMALVALSSNDLRLCEERLELCRVRLEYERTPARSWYDLTNQATRCAFHERRGEWERVIEIANSVDPELARRQYRAIRTTVLSAKARALAALGEHTAANDAVAQAVAACPKSAVDPLIVVETTRAVCDVRQGRTAEGHTRFGRAVAGCRAIGHWYHENWIQALREQLESASSVSVPSPPQATSPDAVRFTLTDVATALGAGHSVDLMAHRLAALFNHTPLAEGVAIQASGGHEYQATPSIAVTDVHPEHHITLRSSDRRVTIAVAGVQTLDDIVLFRNVADIARTAVSHAADTDHESDTPTLWPTGTVAPDDDAVFRSPRIMEVMRVAARLADTELPLLITGETGTGKEILARFIHARSRCRRGPFIPFNGAAIAKDLVESQLFGHRKGAFTGAHEATTGVIRAAEGGTLFLDEVGELDQSVQPKLLRFLELGEIHPVGDPKPIAAKVRLVAATNANLDHESREGRFRRDLFFRLGGATIHLPPLRERKDEIPAMAELFLARASKECGRSGLRLADDFVAALLLHDWPGNIRELVNEIRRAVALAEDGTTLTARDLGPAVAKHWHERPTSQPATESRAGLFVPLDQPLRDALQQVEDRFIERAMELAGGHVTDAARVLGLSRKGLFLKRRRQARADLPQDNQPAREA